MTTVRGPPPRRTPCRCRRRSCIPSRPCRARRRTVRRGAPAGGESPTHRCFPRRRRCPPRRAVPGRSPTSRRGTASPDRRVRAAAARSAAPPRTPARELGDRFRTAPRSAATEIRADHRCARGYTADTARQSRVSTPAPIPARHRDRHAPSPSSGCPPTDTGRFERRRQRRWDGPSRRSHPAPTTNPFRACPRRPWRRERMPHRPATSLSTARVRRGHRHARPAHRR